MVSAYCRHTRQDNSAVKTETLSLEAFYDFYS